MTRPLSRFRDLLETLGVGAGGCVYVQTSFSRISHLELTPSGMIDALLEHLGPTGTLVMPSFAWHLDKAARPWKGYAEYYRTRPLFDVRHTPANIGVVPEVFRAYPDVVRSAHLWWSVAARGPLAAAITRDQHEALYPYGPDSSFGRMHAYGTTLLGLGVTLNTTSLAPVVDHELGTSHTQVIFSAHPEEGTVINESGRHVATRAYWLLPDVVRYIKPSTVFTRSAALGGVLRRADHGDAIQFAYPFEAYFRCAMRLGRAAATGDDRMPWLEDYDVMKAA